MLLWRNKKISVPLSGAMCRSLGHGLLTFLISTHAGGRVHIVLCGAFFIKICVSSTFTTLYAFIAEYKLVMFFIFFPENRV